MSDDDRLLADLADLIGRVDPPPDEVALAARSALAWRRLDAELAELLHDSLRDAVAGVRASGGARTLAFAAGSGAAVDVEVHEDDRGRLTLVGQVVPGGPMPLTVRHRGGAIETTTDAIGRFRAEGVPPGPVSIRCEPPDAAPVETGWLTL